MYLHNWLIHVHAICSSTYMYMKREWRHRLAISNYWYLEVFCLVPWTSEIKRVACICSKRSWIILMWKRTEASRLADQYKEARYIDIVSLTFKTIDRSRSQSNTRSWSPSLGGQQMGRRGFPSNRVSCFNCQGPHIRRYCPQLRNHESWCSSVYKMQIIYKEGNLSATRLRSTDS